MINTRIQQKSATVPPVESVLESPGYTVPEDSGCAWMPDSVPGSDGTNTNEGGFLQSLREPLPPLSHSRTLGCLHFQ